MIQREQPLLLLITSPEATEPVNKTSNSALDPNQGWEKCQNASGCHSVFYHFLSFKLSFQIRGGFALGMWHDAPVYECLPTQVTWELDDSWLFSTTSIIIPSDSHSGSIIEVYIELFDAGYLMQLCAGDKWTDPETDKCLGKTKAFSLKVVLIIFEMSTSIVSHGVSLSSETMRSLCNSPPGKNGNHLHGLKPFHDVTCLSYLHLLTLLRNAAAVLLY